MKIYIYNYIYKLTDINKIINFEQIDPFEDACDDTSTKVRVHIYVEQRKGRKFFTYVSNLPEKCDLKRVSKFLRHTLSTNVFIKDCKYGKCIVLQGDKRDKVIEFLIENLKIEKDMITRHGT